MSKPDTSNTAGHLALRALALDGIMIALSVVLTRFLSINIPIGGAIGARIGLGHLPIIFTGIVLDPIHGFIVGAVADVVGATLWPSGAFIWQITVISALNGVIPALFVRVHWSRSKTARIWIGVTVSRLLLSVGWLPFVLHDVIKLPYWPVVAGQAAGSVIMIPATAFLLGILLQAYERAGFGHVSTQTPGQS
jgi:ECF transporter S component (folate family)